MGMDTCEIYREQVPMERRFAGVAGLFNTATNAMAYHLVHNLELQTEWSPEVPWGKHYSVEAVRLNNTVPGMENADPRDVLPIVMIRDPLFWMQSLCKTPYEAKWPHTARHCPNFVPTQQDRVTLRKKLEGTNGTFPVDVTFTFAGNLSAHWDSLAHFYNDWYQQYIRADFPRLIVRYEDMLLYGPKILGKIAECVGSTTPSEFSYLLDRAKKHGSRSGFVDAVFKSGNSALRLKGLTTEDLAYTRTHIDADLLRLMHYTLPTFGQDSVTQHNSPAKNIADIAVKA